MAPKPRRTETRLALFPLALCLFLLILFVGSRLSHAATLLEWEPQANGLMAVIWDRNDDGRPDLLTLHVIRWHGHSALPLRVLIEQARRDHVWLFWIDDERDHYCYEVDTRPLYPVSHPDWPPWLPAAPE